MILLQSKEKNYTFDTYKETNGTKLVVLNDNPKDIEIETLIRLDKIIKIEFLNINNENIKKFNITKLPTYIFLREGKEVKRFNKIILSEVQKLNECK